MVNCLTEITFSEASFYDPTRDFNCLDGSGTIPFSYVNDDYCDCQDGSDEPGTAACPNGKIFKVLRFSLRGVMNCFTLCV